MNTNLRNPADNRIYPDRWPMHRAKQLFKVYDERSTDGTEELLSVSHITGITPRSQKKVTMFRSESLIGYKVCHLGNVVANTMWTWQGAIGVSKYCGVVSPAYNVYSLIGDFYNHRYLDLLLREKCMIAVYHSLSTGIRPSRLRLYPESFLTIEFPVPPRNEQDQIVRYLDWRVSKINKLISERNHEINLLREAKQKMISEATTKGILNTKRVPVDFVWISEKPENWDTKRLKELFVFGKGLSITKANLVPEGVPVLSYGQIHSKNNTGVRITDDLLRYVSEEYMGASPTALVHEKDFIFADTSEDYNGCGNCSYVDSEMTLFAGYHTIIAHCKHQENGKYLAYLFHSEPWRYQIRRLVNGVKVYSITQNILSSATALIPSIEEQNEIVKYLDFECRKIDAAISNILLKIEKLKEYRSSLISDVVTGQIDVRNIEIPDYEYVEEEAEENEDDIDEETEEQEVDE